MNKKGFTLLEILIALAILFIALASLAYVFPSGMLRLKRARIKERAMQLCQERMEFLKMLDYQKILTTENGRVEEVDVDGDGVSSSFERRYTNVSTLYDIINPMQRPFARPYALKIEVRVTYLSIPPKVDQHGNLIVDEQKLIMYYDKFYNSQSK